MGRGALLVAGAGAIVALLANLDDLKNSESVKSHWWLLPLAVLAIGYMLRRRGNPYGTAVLAVGGALFALSYQIQSAKEAAAKQQPPAPQPAQQLRFGGDVQGPAFVGGGAPVNALPVGSAQGGHFWVQMPDGQLVRVPILAALNAALKRSAIPQRPVAAA